MCFILRYSNLLAQELFDDEKIETLHTHPLHSFTQQVALKQNDSKKPIFFTTKKALNIF